MSSESLNGNGEREKAPEGLGPLKPPANAAEHDWLARPKRPGKMAVGLVHHPVYDRTGDVIATNITNFDIHDIARSCRVFDVDRYFIIHPMQEQQMFVSRVLDHWRTGSGARFNPMRRTALTMVEPAESVEAALKAWGRTCQVVATSARDGEQATPISFRKMRQLRETEDVFLLFGTGWGLSEAVLEQCQYLIEPIRGSGEEDYRHLSVRSAVSICLDRLSGSW